MFLDLVPIVYKLIYFIYVIKSENIVASSIPKMSTTMERGQATFPWPQSKLAKKRCDDMNGRPL